ncbi:hypothetical protein CVT25_004490 [Psilocybe cyanescens]|uniref:BZIP domain-containing protein n=1 Tax=Psilocybe cyanescens TaxID=93625 RepID=A0A409XRR4_PSICY|nr:hypothetical protein CVT25_004490 [Psilocybe cyanescens]
MQTTITKQEMEEQLASISSLFEMPTTSSLEVSGYGTVSGASNMAHHSRSISTESASSSLGGHEHPTRYHPSLGYNPRRISPEGHAVGHSSVPHMRRQQTITVPREVPSYITARHRRHPVPSDDDDDIDDEPLPENATEQERADYKRRQNTLAARRSRKRRLAQFHQLEDDVARLKSEKEMWKERALMMERILSSNGLPCPNFDL